MLASPSSTKSTTREPRAARPLSVTQMLPEGSRARFAARTSPSPRGLTSICSKRAPEGPMMTRRVRPEGRGVRLKTPWSSVTTLSTGSTSSRQKACTVKPRAPTSAPPNTLSRVPFSMNTAPDNEAVPGSNPTVSASVPRFKVVANLPARSSAVPVAVMTCPLAAPAPRVKAKAKSAPSPAATAMGSVLRRMVSTSTTKRASSSVSITCKPGGSGQAISTAAPSTSPRLRRLDRSKMRSPGSKVPPLTSSSFKVFSSKSSRSVPATGTMVAWAPGTPGSPSVKRTPTLETTCA